MAARRRDQRCSPGPTGPLRPIPLRRSLFLHPADDSLSAARHQAKSHDSEGRPGLSRAARKAIWDPVRVDLPGFMDPDLSHPVRVRPSNFLNVLYRAGPSLASAQAPLLLKRKAGRTTRCCPARCCLLLCLGASDTHCAAAILLPQNGLYSGCLLPASQAISPSDSALL